MTGILLNAMGGNIKELDMFKHIEDGGGYVPGVDTLQRVVQENR